MCGIAGVVSFTELIQPGTELAERMCQAMYHRGPDDAGYYSDPKVVMGMRRLSIIDLTGGHQPVSNEDGSVQVVYNGEIYNYPSLRRELKMKGHRFSTESDTEVIVHLWEEMGPELVNRLNGMFALALYDRRQQKFLLARDHIGIKPLFYSLDTQRLVFGSEVKVLLASGLIDRRLDVDALSQFMAWEYVPGAGTLVQSIRKLEPGHYLEIDLADARTRLHQYWDVSLDSHLDPSNPKTEGEWEECVDQTLHQAVQRQLVSDVPLGAFLSGGVDSSLVAAAMGPRAHTFSIGFREASYNELGWAQKVARHLQLEHNFKIIDPRAIELFDRLMHFMDDPIGDFSIFPTYLVSQHARQHVKVALSGDGGDELFGGYETYLAQGQAVRWSRLPRFVRENLAEPLIRSWPPSPKKKGLINKAKRFVEGLEHEPGLGHTRWRLFVGENLRQQLFTPEALEQMTVPLHAHIDQYSRRVAHRDDIDRSLYVDLKSYLVDNCLVKMDRMSMANSLEARVPLLDKDLVELAFRLPSRFKIQNGQTKAMLKKVAARYVPRECVYRPKEGFSIPIKHWIKNDFRPLMEELLNPEQLAREGLFQPDTVRQLKSEHLANKANHSHVLWGLMVFQDWRRRWNV